MKCRLVVALAFAAAASSPRAALACSCMQSGPACQTFWMTNTAAVFDGTVVAIEAFPEHQVVGDRVLPISQKLVTFDVRRTWKGSEATRVSVVTGQGGGDCGFNFQTGRRYLVYAYTRSQDGRLGASICSRTREYDGSGEDAAFLASLSGPAPGGRVSGAVTLSAVSLSRVPSPRQPVETQVSLTGPDMTRTVRSSAGDSNSGTSHPVGTRSGCSFRMDSTSTIPSDRSSFRLRTPAGRTPSSYRLPGESPAPCSTRRGSPRPALTSR